MTLHQPGSGSGELNAPANSGPPERFNRRLIGPDGWLPLLRGTRMGGPVRDLRIECLPF